MLAARFVPGLVSLPLNLRNLSNLWINSALPCPQADYADFTDSGKAKQLES
jgi:hypothetical protein